MSDRQQHLALYPGTFDGLTNGHLDIIRRAASLFDRLCVAIAHNEEKRPLFTVEERLWMLREETRELENVDVASFQGLTVNYATRIGARCIIRGIRVVSDFEYELQMAQMNRALDQQVETIFMFPRVENLYLSSSLIKEVLMLGADIQRFVPASTEHLWRQKLQSRHPAGPE
jgi:pantetheine-phosphate adenylyltransferase